MFCRACCAAVAKSRIECSACLNRMFCIPFADYSIEISGQLRSTKEIGSSPLNVEASNDERALTSQPDAKSAWWDYSLKNKLNPTPHPEACPGEGAMFRRFGSCCAEIDRKDFYPGFSASRPRRNDRGRAGCSKCPAWRGFAIGRRDREIRHCECCPDSGLRVRSTREHAR
jgi:hypothetical protein